MIEAEIETTGTQEELDALHKKVEMACPLFKCLCMITRILTKKESTEDNSGRIQTG